MENQEDMLKAVKYFIEIKEASINLLQTKYNMGFNKAYQIINELEKLNIISHKIKGERTLLIKDFEEAITLIENNCTYSH